MKPIQRFTIKDLNLEDRPREKLLHRGKEALTDAELLGILLGSGNKDQNAVELGQSILHHHQNNLNELARATVKDLEKFAGVGEAKAITIVAALELGRRRKASTSPERPRIRASKDAFDIIAPHLQDLNHEEFWMISLNRANQVLRLDMVSSGGVSGTVADPKIIFGKALENKASSIILAHNHPSGNLKPSQADLDLTSKLQQAGMHLEIPVLDHLIIANTSYFSFLDENQM